LTQLRELFLDQNSLTSLPDSIGQLKSIEWLTITDNQLTSLPEAIGQMTRLTNLFVSGNQLTSLPESLSQLKRLRRLDVSNNQLAALPPWLRALKSLRELHVYGNPRLRLPRSVVGKRVYGGSDSDQPQGRSILDYYFRARLAQGRRPLLEAKLILVGRGEVGKTSLVRRLISNKFFRREDRTQGIRITQWPLTVKRGEQVSMHVWDFGGRISCMRRISSF
jgi:internalin A